MSKLKKYRFSGAVLLSGVLWGVIGLFVRRLDAMGFDSLQISFVRSFFSALLILGILLILRRDLIRIRLRDLWCFVGTGLFSLTFFNLCYFFTMTVTSLSVASVLLYTAPVFVTVMPAILFRERLIVTRALCLLIALAGCVLVTGVLSDAQSLTPIGILTGLGAGFGYALYSIFGRYALERGYHTLTINFWTFLISAICLLPLAKLKTLAAPVLMGEFPWGAVLLLAVVSTVLPYLLYTYGLTGMESGNASVIATVEPVVATVVGIVSFGEQMTVGNACGMALVLVAVILLNLPLDQIIKRKKHINGGS